MVHEVLSDFMEEKKESGREGSFRKTREQLHSFKSFSVDDPFAGDITKLFRRCHGDLRKMIGQLNQTAKKLDKKLRRIRRRRRVSISLFLAAVVTVVASTVVVGVMAAPPVVAAMGVVVSFLPVGSVGVMVSSLWKRSQCFLKRQKAAISSMAYIDPEGLQISWMAY